MNQLAELVLPTLARGSMMLLRMRRLLEEDSKYEDSKMKKVLWLVLASMLVLVQSINVELVAQKPNENFKTVEAVKKQVAEFERSIESLKTLAVSLQSHGDKMKATVEAKIKEVNALRESPDQLSEEGQRRKQMFMSGQEAEQLEALKDVGKHQPRNEALLFCGFAAKQSPFAEVRKAALKAAASMGKEGFPAIAIAYESLNSADRVFLIEQTREMDAADRAAIFALMAKEADKELLQRLVVEPFADDRRLVLIGAIAKEGNDAIIDKVIDQASTTEGEQSLLILYAVAKSKNPKHVLAAIKAASKHGDAAFPVLAAAGKCEDKPVRAELVRVAKALGGEVGEFMIQQALQETDPGLKQAAEEAMSTSKIPKP